MISMITISTDIQQDVQCDFKMSFNYRYKVTKRTDKLLSDETDRYLDTR